MIHYLVLSLFLLGSLGRITWFGQQINVYIYELLFAPFILYLVTRYHLKPIQFLPAKIKQTGVLLYFWSLAGLCITSFLYPIDSTYIAILYFLRLTIYLLGLIYIRYHLSHKSKQTHNHLHLFIALGVTVLSLIQYMFYPNLRNLQYLGWDPHQYRMIATFFDAYVAASIFGLLAITFFFKHDKISQLTASLFVLFGIFTFARSFLLSIVIVAIAYSIKRVSIKKIFIAGFIFLLFIIIAPKPFGEGVNLMRTFSITSRLEDDQNAIKVWKKSPIMGIGYNRIREEKQSKQISSDLSHAASSYHSSFLIILVTIGLLGLALFSYLLILLSQVSAFAFCIVLFLSCMSLFDNVLLHPLVLLLTIYVLPIPRSFASVKMKGKKKKI